MPNARSRQRLATSDSQSFRFKAGWRANCLALIARVGEGAAETTPECHVDLRVLSRIRFVALGSSHPRKIGVNVTAWWRASHRRHRIGLAGRASSRIWSQRCVCSTSRPRGDTTDRQHHRHGRAIGLKTRGGLAQRRAVGWTNPRCSSRNPQSRDGRLAGRPLRRILQTPREEAAIEGYAADAANGVKGASLAARRWPISAHEHRFPAVYENARRPDRLGADRNAIMMALIAASPEASLRLTVQSPIRGAGRAWFLYADGDSADVRSPPAMKSARDRSGR